MANGMQKGRRGDRLCQLGDKLCDVLVAQVEIRNAPQAFSDEWETVMLKRRLALSAAAMAVAAGSIPVPPATAAEPKCKNKQKQYVACAAKLKAKAVPKAKGEKGAGMKDLKAEDHKTKVDEQ